MENYLDLLASIFGILSAGAALRNSVWAYPTGLAGICIYFYLLFEAGIYGDILINFYYFVLSIYGWYLWVKRDKNQKIVLQIHFISVKALRVALLILPFLWGALSYWLYFYTDSTIPLIDALTTALGMMGMYFMMYRVVEYWLFFVLMNILCIFVYAYKGLYFSSIQFFLLTFIAIYGYLQWRKKAV